MSSSTVKGRYTGANFQYSSFYGSAKNPQFKRAEARVALDRQVIESRGNPVSLLGKHTGLDIGGAFRNSRVTVEGGRNISAERLISAYPDDVLNYASGHYFASSEAAQLCSQALTTPLYERQWQELSLPPAADLAMLSAGATAIARCAPTNPAVDLSTSLAELFREGLPSLPGRSGGGFSGEYLNYNFGIAPTLSDVRDLRNVVARADALWQQYARNSGKGVRRRYQFPTETETSSTVENYRVPARPTRTSGTDDGFTGNLLGYGTLWRRKTTTKSMWFSGSFTYYLPDSPLGASVARLDRLYGLRPGIDTMYQLTPWSWLVDYFLNLGDVIENLNSFTSSGLVMPYAYIMSETTVVTESRLDFELWKGSGWRPASVTDKITRKIQRRVPAHPFGFGLSEGDLTPKQKSILIALGLSRT